MSESVAKLRDWNFARRLAKPGRQAFWAWIAYQTVKGTLTTSLIWIPLIYAFWHHGS